MSIPQNIRAREELLLGQDAVKALSKSRVAVFGLGGVGGYCVEALARAGVGTLDLIDGDRVEATNFNRQLLAVGRTLGRYKTDAARDRIAEIDPAIKVNVYPIFFLPETAGSFDFRDFDYVVDAIDTVAGKLEIVRRAAACGTPVISAMGAGNKLDPTKFRVADITETSVDPLARTMRRELKKMGVEHLKVVYSGEAPRKPVREEFNDRGKPIAGSVSFVPSVMGLIIGGEVVKDLIKRNAE